MRDNQHIKNPFVGQSEMKFGPKKDKKLHNIIKHNVIWANCLFIAGYICRHAIVYIIIMFSHICQSIGHHYKRFVDT